MNRWIVITTINKPQLAIEVISKVCKEGGWRCVVIGDKKTPLDWSYENIDYLSIEKQNELYGKLSELLPYNHYCRKNLGYIYAINNGAEYILETDDDNIPEELFGKEIAFEVEGSLIGKSEWVNAYKYFTDEIIWPRGNPLDSIHDSGEFLGKGLFDCPIQQYLADNDPDVDAIYRLIFKEGLIFNKIDPIVLDKNSWCSFNSQNTLINKTFFPALYLPCYVSFRMTDIWRSFVAQAVLWSEDKNLTFKNATVRQERNKHNLMKDFNDEIIGYTDNRKICFILEEKIKEWNGSMSVAEKVHSGWIGLNKAGYITDSEIKIFELWLKEIRVDA